jgi:hypothetical protein
MIELARGINIQHPALSFGLLLLQSPHLLKVSNANFLLNDVTAGATPVPLSGFRCKLKEYCESYGKTVLRLPGKLAHYRLARVGTPKARAMSLAINALSLA